MKHCREGRRRALAMDSRSDEVEQGSAAELDVVVVVNITITNIVIIMMMMIIIITMSGVVDIVDCP